MGYRYLNTGTAVPVFAAEPPVTTEGSLYYNSTSEIFYICNGTQWNLVSNASPSATGGTRTIDALSEGGTFSYDLGDDFTDDVDTDAELTYTLASGTLPSGCTLPTTGNSAFTGTASGVSSNTNYTWTIKATDTSGGTATQDYQQTINTVAPTVTGGTVTISAVNEGSSASYDVDNNFTFGTGSTFSAYSLQSGSLPSGLSLNTSTGVISGTMGEVASTTAYSFTIRGTDTDGDTVGQAYSWTITNVPLSATGGTITTYSSGGVNYKVNTFTSGGTITFNKAGSVDVLLVAGGGGGGAWVGSGGGAGGMIVRPTLGVTAQSYTVTIGGGGARGYNPGGYSGMPYVRPGFDTTAFALTAKGGGAGNSYSHEYAGGTGGSGSGGANNGTNYAGNAANQTSQSGDSGTYGFGNAGGTAPADSGDPYPCGGGGGAGGAGGNSTTTAIGLGGVGKTNNYRTGSNIYYAGGGGGGHHEGDSAVTQWGTGGNGGGGNGNTTSLTNAQSGSANTGGGGGGGGGNGGSVSYGGYGGSGIVVVRYAV